MRRLAFVLSGFALSTFAIAPACVPADGSFALGSAQFEIRGSARSITGGFDTLEFNNGTVHTWHVSFDRVILGFRTMTIGKVGDDDRCSFRGRGEKSDIVFDPRAKLTQTFNGITPANCEDTGIFLSPPGDTTEVGPGATSADLVELASGNPAHALVDVTARDGDRTIRIHFRFDTATTSSRFGGCSGRFEAKGIRVRANERIVSSVIFTPENLFQEGLGFGGRFLVGPFAAADRNNDDDGEVTMTDLDRLPLSSVRVFGDGYQLPDGTKTGSFGDYLRALFRFTFLFREAGTCIGNEPGSE